jgi:hypothetical protein
VKKGEQETAKGSQAVNLVAGDIFKKVSTIEQQLEFVTPVIASAKREGLKDVLFEERKEAESDFVY